MRVMVELNVLLDAEQRREPSVRSRSVLTSVLRPPPPPSLIVPEADGMRFGQ
jgi:hypothetical protein